MKVALVYDRVNKWGGAERVLLALHELFPEAPLYTSVYHAENAQWATVFPRVIPSFVQTLPNASTSHEFYALCMPIAFEQFSFDEYDLVISVTSEAAKGIITKPQTKHICYCLTPTRYLWSGYDDYFSSPLMRFLGKPAVSYLRAWDTVAATRPDVMVAVSEEVKKRIKTYYDRESEVIYPALATLAREALGEKPQGEYFLVVSRLVPYKRVDLAIAACNDLGLPLIVVGTGSEEKRLKRMAGETVRFVGRVSDEELATYYRNARAFLFPGEEDFGLTVVEAQSFGTPVIAYKKGGVLETIIEGKTGLFFSHQTVTALKSVLKDFRPQDFDASEIALQARKFSTERFMQSIRGLVDQVVKKRLT